MAWPAIIREVISVGEVEQRENGLWLTNCTQRLHPYLGTACHTTVFAKSGELGETSGSAARVTGLLVELHQIYACVAIDTLVSFLIPDQQAHDENDLSWVVANGNGR